MQEIWKDIYFEENGVIWDYRGYYQVSNLGKIKSLERKIWNGKVHYTRQEKIMKPTKNKNGYQLIGLKINKNEKKFLVHRLVAIHFIQNPNNKPQVNHEDGNKENCCVSNLTWVTNGENQKHAYKIGLKKIGEEEKQRFRKRNKEHEKKIIQYDKQGNFIREWECISECARQLKINGGNIVSCLKGRQKTSYNYIWKYKDTK